MNNLKECYNKYVGWIVLAIILIPLVVVLDFKILKLVKLIIRDLYKNKNH